MAVTMELNDTVPMMASDDYRERFRAERLRATMELNDTVPMMASDDYRERFRAEFHQVRIRQERLYRLLCYWDDGMLEFVPNSPHLMLARQYKVMGEYLAILEERAQFEDIDLYAPAVKVAR